MSRPSTLDWKSIGAGRILRYAAVEVVLIDGTWRFFGTPFFYRHAPWASDYG